VLAGAALLAAAGWFAARQGWIPGFASSHEVLAVLPFENTSEDPSEAAFLGEGLGQELVARLGEGVGYRVLPWATTRRFVGAQEKLTNLARALRATALLVGSFRADGDRIRVTAVLVDGHSGVQRWSRAFDQLASDLMSIQANITLGIASQLEGPLAAGERSARERGPSVNPEAYELYLRGAAAFQSGDQNEKALAELFYRRALELDPNLAEAHVGLGAVHKDAHFRGLPGGRERLRLARAEFERALKLKPRMSRAERGLVIVGYEMGQLESILELAVEIAKRGDNNVEDLITRGTALQLGGLPADAVPLFERAAALDPLSQEAAWWRTMAFAWSGQSARTMEAGRQFVRRFGEDPEIFTHMSVSAYEVRGLGQALTLIDRALELFGDHESNLYVTCFAARFYDEAGQRERMRVMIEHWLPRLEMRRLASADNVRVLAVEAVLRARAGDRAGVLAIVDSLAELSQRERGTLGMSLGVALPAAIILRDDALLDRIIRLLRGEDLAAHHALLFAIPALPPEALGAALEGTPAGRDFVRDVQARVAELRARYAHRIGSRAGQVAKPGRTPRVRA
jgi:TolB-like protein